MEIFKFSHFKKIFKPMFFSQSRLLQKFQPGGKPSFLASEALHRMVFRAKRDPESSPAIGGIQAILDSLFRRITEQTTLASASI